MCWGEGAYKGLGVELGASDMIHDTWYMIHELYQQSIAQDKLETSLFRAWEVENCAYVLGYPVWLETFPQHKTLK